MATHHNAVKYLATTKIGEKGQLTVPKQFRRDLGLGTGAPFAVLQLGDGLILLPEQQRFEQLCQQVSASLTAGGWRGLNAVRQSGVRHPRCLPAATSAQMVYSLRAT